MFGRKSKACIGKKQLAYSKLNQLDSKMNSTLQKYINIFGEFLDRIPDEYDDDDGDVEAEANTDDGNRNGIVENVNNSYEQSTSSPPPSSLP